MYDDWLTEEWQARLAVLIPAIERDAADAEAQRNLTSAAVAALQDAGVTNLYLPTSLGGQQVDPVTCALITEQISRSDSAAGWFVMVANSSRLLASSWPAQLVERLWLDNPQTLIAASGHNMLRAERVAGSADLLVSGEVGFASGVQHTQWVAAPALIAGAGEPERCMVVIPVSDCTIRDDWHVIGMRGTGSNTAVIDGVRVPQAQVASIAERLEVANPYYTGALYRCPGRILFATYVPISLALAERALAALDALARVKVPASSSGLLRERQLAQAKYGKALANYRAARGYFLDALREAWERAQRGESASDTQRADLYLAGTHGVQAAAQTVRLVADAAGTSAIYEQGPLAQIVRDIEVLRHHGFASENRYASVAQQYWGSTLDYPLLLR